MHIVLIALCFGAAVVLTLQRGPGLAFIYVYLPALLLFSHATTLPLPGLPE